MTHLIITEVLQLNVIFEDGNMMSLGWMRHEKWHGDFWFSLKTLVIEKSNVILVTSQFLYTTATLCPLVFFYRYRLIHNVWMIATFLWAVWNGAIFYIESFARKYVKNLENYSERKWAYLRAIATAAPLALKVPTMSVTPSLPGCHPSHLTFQ